MGNLRHEWMSVRRLADFLGVDDRQVRRAVRSLEQRGLVELRRNGIELLVSKPGQSEIDAALRHLHFEYTRRRRSILNSRR